MRKGSLTKTIFFTIIAASLLPMVIFGFFIASISKDLLEKEFVNKLDFYNTRLADDINVFISKNRILVETFLDVHALHDKRPITPLHRDITAFVNMDQGLSGLSFLNSDGEELGYFGPRSRTDYLGDLPLIIKSTVDAKEFFIGSIHRNPVKRKLSLILSFPMKDAPLGKSAGVAAVGDFNMEQLGATFANSVPKDLLTLVFTKSGFLIYSSVSGLATDINNDYRNKLDMLSSHAAQDKPFVVRTKESLGVLTVAPLTGWLIYVEQPSSVLNGLMWKGFKNSSKYFLYVFGGILLMALFLSLHISNMVVKPVKTMTRAVKCIEDGDINNLPALPLPNNEIGALAMAFAKMADSLKLKFDSLEQDRRDLEELNQSLELRVGSRTKELKTALGELIKKERLAAIGQMASIVSHEIKNPLAVMANSIYLIKARIGADGDHRILKNISIMEQEIKQANGIIEEILGYARTREQILTVVDMNMYMKEILTSYPFAQNIQVITDFAKEHLPVHIDSEEMKQAVRNLIGNAVEVMPDGGQLVVKTKKDGNNIILSVRDSGPGIPPDIQEKIFAPFFTTKARGTGLGLAVVKKMASRNNADILLQSEVGKGTKISIILPQYEEKK